MLFDSWWYKLNVKRAITSDVRMNPAQFRNMLKQAYDAGHSEGYGKAVKSGKEWARFSEQATPNTFDDFFKGFGR